MPVKYSKEFLKHYKKRVYPNKRLAERYKERLATHLENPKDPALKDHRLSGAKKHLRAFSVTGDLRVVYYYQEEWIVLVDIGTHNQVY